MAFGIVIVANQLSFWTYSCQSLSRVMLPRPHNNNKQKILLLRTIALFRSRDYRQAPTSIIFHGGLICVGRNLSPIPAVITSRQGSRTLHQFWCLRNFEFADYHPNEYPASLSLPTLPVSPRLRITIIFNLTTIQLFQLIMMIKISIRQFISKTLQLHSLT